MTHLYWQVASIKEIPINQSINAQYFTLLDLVVSHPCNQYANGSALFLAVNDRNISLGVAKWADFKQDKYYMKKIKTNFLKNLSYMLNVSHEQSIDCFFQYLIVYLTWMHTRKTFLRILMQFNICNKRYYNWNKALLFSRFLHD